MTRSSQHETISISYNEGLALYRWSATLAGYDGPECALGQGDSPEEALSDLINQLDCTGVVL